MRDNVGIALVVSGEVAGVKAAIDLADSGFSVYLLDESTSIEGVMIALDRILRTNDCPLCTLPPKPADGTEDTKIGRTPRKNVCSGCKPTDPFANAAPSNKSAKKPNGVRRY